MSAAVRAAEEAVPKADSAQRRLVIRLMRMLEPSPVNRMKARSPARPGLGRYQRGSLTSAGSICSMSVVSGIPRSRGVPPPPSTNVRTVLRLAARRACSGSAMIRCT